MPSWFRTSKKFGLILWTTKSLRNIEKALREKGFAISHDTIGNILKETGYSLRQNQKMPQVGMAHPDRNAQFEYLNHHRLKAVVLNLAYGKEKETIRGRKTRGGAFSCVLGEAILPTVLTLYSNQRENRYGLNE
jgi:hypothetical protein